MGQLGWARMRTHRPSAFRKQTIAKLLCKYNYIKYTRTIPTQKLNWTEGERGPLIRIQLNEYGLKVPTHSVISSNNLSVWFRFERIFPIEFHWPTGTRRRKKTTTKIMNGLKCSIFWVVLVHAKTQENKYQPFICRMQIGDGCHGNNEWL